MSSQQEDAAWMALAVVALLMGGLFGGCVGDTMVNQDAENISAQLCQSQGFTTGRYDFAAKKLICWKEEPRP